jgi:hypothetical protein
MSFLTHHSRKTRRQGSPGFTILLAALVASLVLSIGISIYSVARKSVTLSTLGRDSQFAFYAADTAAECALYWDDSSRDAFSTTTPAATISCDQDTATVEVTNASWPGMELTVGDDNTLEPNGRCAIVTVTKRDTAPQTTIRADGYNVPCSERTTNPRTLQRSVELNY